MKLFNGNICQTLKIGCLWKSSRSVIFLYVMKLTKDMFSSNMSNCQLHNCIDEALRVMWVWCSLWIACLCPASSWWKRWQGFKLLGKQGLDLYTCKAIIKLSKQVKFLLCEWQRSQKKWGKSWNPSTRKGRVKNLPARTLPRLDSVFFFWVQMHCPERKSWPASRQKCKWQSRPFCNN